MPNVVEATQSTLTISGTLCSGLDVYLPGATPGSSFSSLKQNAPKCSWVEYTAPNGYSSIKQVVDGLMLTLPGYLDEANKFGIPIKVVGYSSAMPVMLELMSKMTPEEREKYAWVMIEPAPYKLLQQQANDNPQAPPYLSILKLFKEMLAVTHRSTTFTEYSYASTLENNESSTERFNFEMAFTNWTSSKISTDLLINWIDFLKVILEHHATIPQAKNLLAFFCKVSNHSNGSESKRFTSYFLSYLTSVAAFHTWCVSLDKTTKTEIDEKLLPLIHIIATKHSIRQFGTRLNWGSSNTPAMSVTELEHGTRYTCLDLGSPVIELNTIKPIHRNSDPKSFNYAEGLELVSDDPQQNLMLLLTTFITDSDALDDLRSNPSIMQLLQFVTTDNSDSSSYDLMFNSGLYPDPTKSGASSPGKVPLNTSQLVSEYNQFFEGTTGGSPPKYFSESDILPPTVLVGRSNGRK